MRRKISKKKVLLLAIASFSLVLVAGLLYFPNKASSPSSKLSSQTSKTVQNDTSTTPFHKSQYPLDEASSLWAVVNKGRALPADYVPANLVVPNIPLRLGAGAAEMHLRADAASALEKMTADAVAQNAALRLASGYRSYYTQKALNASYAKIQGQAEADKTSAHAGHSEHQSGLAADLEPADRSCEVEECFADTAAGRWLVSNAAKYGFIIRYPKDKTAQTGYAYEPWHVRYVGTELAAQLGTQTTTMEEFFGLTYYTDYPAQPLVLH